MTRHLAAALLGVLLGLGACVLVERIAAITSQALDAPTATMEYETGLETWQMDY